jgi:hypothetical protein
MTNRIVDLDNPPPEAAPYVELLRQRDAELTELRHFAAMLTRVRESQKRLFTEAERLVTILRASGATHVHHQEHAVVSYERDGVAFKIMVCR